MFNVAELRTLMPGIQGRGPGDVEWIDPDWTAGGKAQADRRIVDRAWSRAARPPSAIVGTPVRPDCLLGAPKAGETLTGSAVSLQQIEQARPVGFEAVLGGDGALYAAQGLVTAGQAADSLAQRTLSGHHGYVLVPKDGRLMAGVRPVARPERIAQTALFLGALEPGNFGSFLLRILPQLLVLAEARVAHDLIVVPDRTPWMLEALELLGFNKGPVLSARESAGFRFDRIWMVQNAYNTGAIGPAMQARMQELAKSCAGYAPFAAKRLYLSRALQSITRPHYRNLQNEREIEDWLQPRGFSVTCPETWGLKRQIGLLSTSEAVVGPSGSGTLLSAFAPEGARVLDLESYNTTVAQHARVYATTGKQYGFAFGSADDDGSVLERRAWRLDMGILGDGMAQMQML